MSNCAASVPAHAFGDSVVAPFEPLQYLNDIAWHDGGDGTLQSSHHTMAQHSTIDVAWQRASPAADGHNLQFKAIRLYTKCQVRFPM
jgi:hypothetical protein